ncbi:MAG: hypothetical protein ACLR4Z_00660 [Butyricicoccaceae bacterium]
MQYHTRQKDSILALLQEQEEQFLTVDEIRLRLTQDGISGRPVHRLPHRRAPRRGRRRLQGPSVDRSSARYCYVGRPETAAHGKLVCLQCGATRPLECHMLDELSQHLEGAHGFRIEPSRTVLYGLCAKCADGIEHSEHSCKEAAAMNIKKNPRVRVCGARFHSLCSPAAALPPKPTQTRTESCAY